MDSRSKIEALDIILTAGCNLRCSYCYQNDKKSRHMEWDTLRAALDLSLHSLQPEVRLLFIGGEPLLEFPMIQRAVDYVERARPPHLKVFYDIVTNGTMLGEEQIAFLVDHGFEVQISFDGVPAAQELRGKGTFAVVDRVFDHVRSDHRQFFDDNLSVALTLLPRTIGHFAESIDYFLAKGLQDIAISPAITFQPDWRTERITELDQAFGHVFRSCLRTHAVTGKIPLRVFRHEEGESVHQPSGRSMCGVGRLEKPAVDVDGQVLGCVTFAESYQVFPTAFLRSRLEALRMGDVRDSGLPDRMAAYKETIRTAGLFYEKQSKFSSYGRCGECRFLRTCAVCPVSIGQQPGNSDPHRVPDFLCAYNLVSLKYREQFPAALNPYDILLGNAAVPQLTRELEAFAVGLVRDRPVTRPNSELHSVHYKPD